MKVMLLPDKSFEEIFNRLFKLRISLFGFKESKDVQRLGQPYFNPTCSRV